MCDNCEHKAVCSIYRATGGVKSCEHFRETPKKGEWVWHECGWWQCSECACSPADWEADSKNEYGLPPFCHSCGADMRGTEDG